MQSTFEWRRIAPLHFWAKADNARLSAATLWHLCEDDVAVRAVIGEVGYRGTPAIAYEEAFWREAAVALELSMPQADQFTFGSMARCLSV